MENKNRNIPSYNQEIIITYVFLAIIYIPIGIFVGWLIWG